MGLLPAPELSRCSGTRANWTQLNLRLPDGIETDQFLVAELGPTMTRLQDGDAVGRWWLLRKPPGLRVRVRTVGGAAPGAARDVLDDLVSQGVLTSWHSAIYEPERRAFGGTAALAVAHTLFCDDSRNLLAYLTGTTTDSAEQREHLGLLLVASLLRGARLDWYEQGDVWNRVARHRAHVAGTPNQTAVDRTRRLLSVDIHHLTSDATVPPAWVATWTHAYRDAGAALARLDARGALTRGIRAVAAHHVLFAWNRLGLSHDAQARLVLQATIAIFDEEIS
ncbi:thiopeptide-type bacteriocin biosynthesis protein [Antribacter sp. KLBMP9083]|uniref:Thiopeptide-type bacteriocin biosynthesis protein n=1 Tax=Antribacter soli TaxID=2910976 RepID=A0AA41U7X6_9MICO|nr:thiopeptide-type bacteriocin biosynthesis protein [Antribacter soli]MCF4122071.1 thiopeptide-type bacteriocin biosynthesis protein [Antribacter soli]